MAGSTMLPAFLHLEIQKTTKYLQFQIQIITFAPKS